MLTKLRKEFRNEIYVTNNHKKVISQEEGPQTFESMLKCFRNSNYKK